MAKRRNDVTICGKIISDSVLAYEKDGEKFYEILVKEEDEDNGYEHMNICSVTLSENLLKNAQVGKGVRIYVKGGLRNRCDRNNGSKISLTVFADCLFPGDKKDSYGVRLVGVICKPVLLQKTDKGKTIVRTLISIEREENRSDYIPLITDDYQLEEAKSLAVGDQITVSGYLRSIQHKEEISSTEMYVRTEVANEVFICDFFVKAKVDKKFIDDHKELIDEHRWAELYEELFATFWCFDDGDCNEIGKFTELMISDGVDPLEKLDYIPEHYLTGASIEKFVVPKHIKRIKQFAFANCSQLTDIIIPNGVTSIDYGAFCGCESLVQAHIPDSVTELGWQVFCDCVGLVGVTLGKCVREIPTNAFHNCVNLKQVLISNGVTCIRDRVFTLCRSLTKIIIPDSVKEIDRDAFLLCEGKNLPITICASKGSYAEKFAGENNFSFEEV